MSIQILIYDDNAAMRESLRMLINEEPDFTVVAMMDNAETIETDVRELNPDIVLMDIDMPNVDGVAAVKKIRMFNADIPVIMLTVFDDNENIFTAICAGASGYILKRHVSIEISGAIRNALNGGAPMTGTVAKKVLQMLPVRETENSKSVLTGKETEVLKLLANGYSYKMIAGATNISIDTVRFHIKKIYEKLHVNSSTQAVSKAIKDRLV